MALGPDLTCPPCSGTGRKRLPDGRDNVIDHGLCPMCDGAGEVTLRRLETFWSCARNASAMKLMMRVPWVCAEEHSWL